MADPAELVNLAQRALRIGKVDDALSLLSLATTRDPSAARAWLHKGSAHVKQGDQDAAAVCFLKAFTVASSSTADAQVKFAAGENVRLLAEKLLPYGWTAQLNDTQYQAAWKHATQYHTARLPADSGTHHLAVVNGLGLEAITCFQAAALQLHRPIEVHSIHTSGFTQAITAQALKANSLHPTIPLHSLATLTDDPKQAPSLHLSALLLPHICTPAFTPAATIALLRSLRPLLTLPATPLPTPAAKPTPQPDTPKPDTPTAPVHIAISAVSCDSALTHPSPPSTGPTISAAPTSSPCPIAPAKIIVMGAAVASTDLLAMNSVRTDLMQQDTGLQYGYANDLLARPRRALQVSRFKCTFLTPPVQLLEVSLADLLTHEGPFTAAAAAELLPTTAGRVDCIVWWTEHELVPGVRISNAPLQLQGLGPAEAVQQPHKWQYVAYLSDRPFVNLESSLRVTLQVEGDDLQLTAAPTTGSSNGTPAATQPNSSSAPASSASTCSSSVADAAAEFCCLAEGAGQGVSSDAESFPSSSQAGQPWWAVAGRVPTPAGSEAGPDSNSEQGGYMEGAAGVCAGAGEEAVEGEGQEDSEDEDKEEGSMAQQVEQLRHDLGSMVLPYHMSMLNDRGRTLAYRDGIQGAVQRMLGRSNAAGAEEPPVVLDLGMGTGLLSMLAAQAGAPIVIGCERELPLATTAAVLVAENELQEAVSVAHALSTQLKPGEDGGGLPQRASLVVHEIFGTDPLSERVLPSLAHAQEHLVTADAEFMPSAVRVVAALAHSQTLHSLHQPVHASSRLDLSPLAILAPRKVELNIEEVPDLHLLTAPTSVLAIDFQTRPVPHRGTHTLSTPTLHAPLPLSQWISQQRLARLAQGKPPVPPACARTPLQGTASSDLPTPSALQQVSAAHVVGGPESTMAEVQRSMEAGGGKSVDSADAALEANCVVHWFECNCGEGGWLSSEPGTTYYGHWSQSVELLPAVVQVPPGAPVELSARFVADRVLVSARMLGE